MTLLNYLTYTTWITCWSLAAGDTGVVNNTTSTAIPSCPRLRPSLTPSISAAIFRLTAFLHRRDCYVTRAKSHSNREQLNCKNHKKTSNIFASS